MHQTYSPRGFTLLETVLVLAIIGLVSGAIWIGYSSAVRYGNNEKQDQQIAGLLQMSRDYLQQFNESNINYYNLASTAKNITSFFINPNLLPSSVQTATNPIPVQYGTGLTISTFPSTGNPYNTGPLVMLSLAGLDKSSCVDILDRWGGSPTRIASSGIAAIAVTLTPINSKTDIAGNDKLSGLLAASLQTSDIIPLCVGSNNTIDLIFRLNP